MKLKIKSEAFFKNYVTSNGGKITYDDQGRIHDVHDDVMGDSVNYMMVVYMGKILNGVRKDNYYATDNWNWPLWMCEEVDDEA